MTFRDKLKIVSISHEPIQWPKHINQDPYHQFITQCVPTISILIPIFARWPSSFYYHRQTGKSTSRGSFPGDGSQAEALSDPISRSFQIQDFLWELGPYDSGNLHISIYPNYIPIISHNFHSAYSMGWNSSTSSRSNINHYNTPIYIYILYIYPKWFPFSPSHWWNSSTPIQPLCHSRSSVAKVSSSVKLNTSSSLARALHSTLPRRRPGPEPDFHRGQKMPQQKNGILHGNFRWCHVGLPQCHEQENHLRMIYAIIKTGHIFRMVYFKRSPHCTYHKTPHSVRTAWPMLQNDRTNDHGRSHRPFPNLGCLLVPNMGFAFVNGLVSGKIYRKPSPFSQKI